jgi:hypothetical protein
VRKEALHMTDRSKDRYQKNRINCYAALFRTLQLKKGDETEERGKEEISDNGTSHSQNKSNTPKKYRVSEGHRSFKYQCFENASEATA